MGTLESQDFSNNPLNIPTVSQRHKDRNLILKNQLKRTQEQLKEQQEHYLSRLTTFSNHLSEISQASAEKEEILRGRIASLEGKNDASYEAITLQQQEIERLEEELQKKQAQVEDLCNNDAPLLERADEEIGLLHEDIAAYKEKIKELGAVIQELREDNGLLNNEIVRLETELANGRTEGKDDESLPSNATED